MSLTPLDIHNKEFSVRLRGYDQQQVNDYLDEIIREFENLLMKQEEMEKKIQFNEEKIAHFHGIQETLNKSIIVAQDAADRLKQNANKEAEMIIFEAERVADKILKDAARQATKINRETDALQRDSRVFRQKVQLMVETQLEMIKSEEWDNLLNNSQGPEVIAPTVKEVMDERKRRVKEMSKEQRLEEAQLMRQTHGITPVSEDLTQTKAFKPLSDAQLKQGGAHPTTTFETFHPERKPAEGKGTPDYPSRRNKADRPKAEGKGLPKKPTVQPRPKPERPAKPQPVRREESKPAPVKEKVERTPEGYPKAVVREEVKEKPINDEPVISIGRKAEAPETPVVPKEAPAKPQPSKTPAPKKETPKAEWKDSTQRLKVRSEGEALKQRLAERQGQAENPLPKVEAKRPRIIHSNQEFTIEMPDDE